jgi:uncharacterized OsmC-like protein
MSATDQPAPPPMQPVPKDTQGCHLCVFDRDALESLINSVKQNPEAGKTVWSASTRWHGGFRSQAEIRGFQIQMDEPLALGGTDTGPNMVEVVLGALGCCLTTGYAVVSKKMGIALEGVEVLSDGDLDLRGFFGLADPDDVWPGYTTVRVTVRLLAPTATDEQLHRLHDIVTRTCPVLSIISRPVKVQTRLEIGRLALSEDSDIS